MKLYTLLLLSAMGAFAQTTVQTEDMSPPGSPVVFSGTASCSEWMNGKELRSRGTGSVKARNVSSRQIVAIVAVTKTVCPHAMEDMLYQHDFFFKAHAFAQDLDLDIPLSINEGTDSYDLSAPANPPASTATLLFVQFDDGSIVGDKEVALNMLGQRTSVQTFLTRLSTASGDKSAFLAILAEEQPPNTSVKDVSRNLNALQKQFGTEATVARVKEALQSAEDRMASGKFKL